MPIATTTPAAPVAPTFTAPITRGASDYLNIRIGIGEKGAPYAMLFVPGRPTPAEMATLSNAWQIPVLIQQGELENPALRTYIGEELFNIASTRGIPFTPKRLKQDNAASGDEDVK